MKFEEIRGEVDSITEPVMAIVMVMFDDCKSLSREALKLIQNESYTEELSIWWSVRELGKRIDKIGRLDERIKRMVITMYYLINMAFPIL